MLAQSLREFSEAIHSQRLSCRKVVEACLERIERYDAQVKAWVTVDSSGARQTADRRDIELRQGYYRGPLHGIPVGIKDIIDVEGYPTTAGSPLRRNHRAGSDAPTVAALREAGAVILGKTVTVEFACFDPSPTRNPWNLQHSPGGSSSGSAAAVATGMCVVALGSQTGGSLVRPASYCGIATCKPTFGRVDTTGVVPVSYHLDHIGPMCRRVNDLETVLDVLPRPREFGWPTKPPPEAERPAAGSLARPRLGFVEPFFTSGATPEVRRVVGEAIDRLQGAGAVVEPITVAYDFEHLLSVHTDIMAAESGAWHREQFAAHRDQYGPMITSLLERGLAMSAVDYAAALAELRSFRGRASELLGDCDALIMPATETTAPASLDTTGDKRNQAPWSCAGLPVVAFPCGLDTAGLPVSVQLVGRHHEDARLLALGRWCESVIEFDAWPPLACS